MMDNPHISEKDYILFQQNLMDQSDLLDFLEHISSCDYCAQQLAAHMNKEIISAPRDLKANILKATKRKDIQLSQKVRESSKSLQLFIYSLKVGAATLCALFLLTLTTSIYSGTFNNPEEIWTQSTENNNDNKSLTSTIREGMNTINSSILDFSNNIMNMEVYDYDKKEE